MEAEVDMSFKVMSHVSVFVFAVFIFLESSPTPAYAYLDPGTGTIYLQVLIAAIGAAFGFICYYLNKIRHLFKSLRGGSLEC